MINVRDITKQNIKEHNPKWPLIPDHPYEVLITGGCRSGSINSLFDLISNQPDIDKIYLHAKDPYKAKYQFLINKQESAGLNPLNDSKTYIDYPNYVEDIYRRIKFK